MMTLKEKVEAAFRFEEVRPTPYTVWYDQEASAKLDQWYGGDSWQSTIRNHIIRITIDWRPRNFIGDFKYADIHGSLWEAGTTPRLIEPALKEPGLAGFEIPSYVPQLLEHSNKSVNKGWQGRYTLSFHETKELLKAVGDSVYTEVDFGPGILESAWMIRGYEEFFMDLVSEPAFACGLLDLLLERHMEILDVLAQLPCDAILITDDFGDQRGVTIGPDRWRRFIKPRLAKQYERILSSGKTTFHHSCGSVIEILPDLIDCGLMVLQSVQPEAMPVYEIKRRYGHNLRLWGGFGVQRLLPFGSPAAIRNEVRRLKSELGKNGGYVLTSSKHITGDIPVENIVALVEESVAADI